MRRPVEYQQRREERASSRVSADEKKRQPLAGRPGFIDINQYRAVALPRLLAVPMTNLVPLRYPRVSCRPGFPPLPLPPEKTGGAGAAYAIGIGMNIHPRTHNFARNAGRFPAFVLHDQNQLLNGIGWSSHCAPAARLPPSCRDQQREYS